MGNNIIEKLEKEKFLMNLKNHPIEKIEEKSLNGNRSQYKINFLKILKDNFAIILGSALGVALIIHLYSVSVPDRLTVKEANEYMYPNIISTLEHNDVDYVLSTKGVDLKETSITKLENFVKNLREQGFKPNEILYAVKENLGIEDADLIAKMVYDCEGGLAEFVDKKYDFDGQNGISENEQFELSKNGYVDQVERLIGRNK